MPEPVIRRDIKQRTDEWHLARCGKITAGACDKIVTPKTRKLSASSDEYMAKLLAEMLTGIPDDGMAMNKAMQDGVDFEPMARSTFTFQTGLKVEEVGGIEWGLRWTSPDGIIDGGRELLELKKPLLKTHILYLLNPSRLLNDYACQVHGQLAFSPMAERVHLYSFAPELPPVHLVIERDDFTAELGRAVDEFELRLLAALDTIKAMEVR